MRVDGGHEDDGEEGADVEDHELFLRVQARARRRRMTMAKRMWPRTAGAGSLLVGGEVGLG